MNEDYERAIMGAAFDEERAEIERLIKLIQEHHATECTLPDAGCPGKDALEAVLLVRPLTFLAALDMLMTERQARVVAQ